MTPRSQSTTHSLTLPIIAIVFLGLWKFVVWSGGYPDYLLPAPERVWQRFVNYLPDGRLGMHVAATLTEVVAGFLIGTAFGLVLGYPVAKSKILERLAVPAIVASQSLPVVALAPLLIVWFGTGYWSKILVSALITFFPVMINTIMGFRAIEPKYTRLMASLNANRWQVFRKIEIQRALPNLFAGFRIAAPLAVVGAVVGEFLGASRGLGFLIRMSQGLFDTPLMFVALILLVLMGMLFYLFFVLLEKIVLHQVRYF